MDADEQRDAAESLLLFSQNPRESASPNTQERSPVVLQEAAIAPSPRNTSSNLPEDREGVRPPRPTRPTIDTSVGVQANPTQRGARPRRIRITPGNALQAYLIRLQMLAGIPPQQMVPMTGQVPYPGPQYQQQGFVNNPDAPSVVQVSNRGVMAPHIQPASFNGVFNPPRTVPGQIHRPVGHARAPYFANGYWIYPGEVRPQRGRLRRGRMVPLNGRRHSSGDGSDDNTTTGQPTGNMDPRVQWNGQTLHSQGASPGGGTGQRIEAPHNGFDLIEVLCRCLDLAQMVTDYLDVQDLIHLYSISRSCQNMFNHNYQRFTLRHARLNAPQSARVFPYLCYYWLFIPGKFALHLYHPINRRLEMHPIPTFRWLAMVRHREAIVNDIIHLMEQDGFRLPEPCTLVIKKLWFLMDIPDNCRREWTIRNRKLWEDIDLFFAMFFLVQLDICLRRRHNKPNGALRRLVMAQPSLMFLWRVLNNMALTNQFEVVDAFVRWQYTPESREPGAYIFGVPSEQVGLLQYEGYHPNVGTQLLQRPDEIVVREMVRRRLHMQTMYRDIFLLGNTQRYTNPGSRDAAWDEEMRQTVGESDGYRDWLHYVILEPSWKAAEGGY